MNFKSLRGKKVIDSEARVIGEVKDVLFNPSTWEITDLILRIEKDVGKELGWRKIVGSFKATLKTSFVKTVGDVIYLTINMDELKGAMRKYQEG